MSKLYDGFKSSEGDSGDWYLKISDDVVYGPIALSALRDWAAEGRITPGNQVSKDNKAWSPVENVPALKMDWLVELKTGEIYGPFNLLAAPHPRPLEPFGR